MNRTIGLGGFLFGACLLWTGCFLPYVAQQGYYQAKLLRGREPISKLLQKETLDPHQKERLKLILEIKEFTTTHLDFTLNDNYTTANLAWSSTIYNVSACKPLQFEPYTWWFPIMGRLPYKGYFNKSDALKEKDRLLAKNWDVQMQVVAGYSSLGYFRDPVLPSMLDMPLGFLVELIIHELAHATVYFKNQTDFNESFANAVGKIGALEFLAKRFGKNSPEYEQTVLLYRDEALYNTQMWQLYQKLDAIYQSDLSEQEKYIRKEQTIAQEISDFKKLPFSTDRFRNANLNGINNASLLSFKRYHSEQKNFARLLNYFEHKWHPFILKIRSLKREKDPFLALHLLAEKLDAPQLESEKN